MWAAEGILMDFLATIRAGNRRLGLRIFILRAEMLVLKIAARAIIRGRIVELEFRGIPSSHEQFPRSNQRPANMIVTYL